MSDVELIKFIFIMNVNIGIQMKYSKTPRELNYDLINDEAFYSASFAAYDLIKNNLKINRLEYRILEESLIAFDCWGSHERVIRDLEVLIDDEKTSWLFETNDEIEKEYKQLFIGRSTE